MEQDMWKRMIGEFSNLNEMYVRSMKQWMKQLTI
jgi:hypothetical protein